MLCAVDRSFSEFKSHFLSSLFPSFLRSSIENFQFKLTWRVKALILHFSTQNRIFITHVYPELKAIRRQMDTPLYRQTHCDVVQNVCQIQTLDMCGIHLSITSQTERNSPQLQTHAEVERERGKKFHRLQQIDLILFGLCRVHFHVQLEPFIGEVLIRFLLRGRIVACDCWIGWTKGKRGQITLSW